MKLEINEEQIAYLKGLKSGKKKRKFLLNCIIENIKNVGIMKISGTGVKESPWYKEQIAEADRKLKESKDSLHNKISESVNKTYSEVPPFYLDEAIEHKRITEQASESSKDLGDIKKFKIYAEDALENKSLSLKKCVNIKNQLIEYLLYDLASKFKEKEKELIEKEKPQGELLKFDKLEDENIEKVDPTKDYLDSLGSAFNKNEVQILDVFKFVEDNASDSKTYSDSQAVTLDKNKHYSEQGRLVVKEGKLFDTYHNEFYDSEKHRFSFGEMQRKNDEPAKNIDKCDVCHIYPKADNSNKCESCDFAVKHAVSTSPEFAKNPNNIEVKSEEVITEKPRN